MNKLQIASFVACAVSLSACSSNVPAADPVAAAETVPDSVVAGPAPEPAPAAAAEPASAPTATKTPLTTAVPVAKPVEDTKSEWKKITLKGYDCGDNCYVEFSAQDKGSEAMTALCSAKICGDWERAGVLPAAYKGKTVEVKYNTAPRTDGSGKVVDSFANITEMRVTK
jgi:hypothetical protein